MDINEPKKKDFDHFWSACVALNITSQSHNQDEIKKINLKGLMTRIIIVHCLTCVSQGS